MNIALITDLTFPYLLKEPAKQVQNPTMLLLLHGFGSNEQDLFSFASELPNDIYFACARAPLTIFPNGFAWYTIDFTRGIKFTDGKQANESVQSLRKFIPELQARYKIAPKNFFLGGFSQGAIMSYGVAVNEPKLISGVLAMSGYVLKDYLPEKIDKAAMQELKMMTIHGTADEVIPVKMGQMGRDYMKGIGVNLDYKEYYVGHGVSPEGLRDIVSWFNTVR